MTAQSSRTLEGGRLGGPRVRRAVGWACGAALVVGGLWVLAARPLGRSGVPRQRLPVSSVDVLRASGTPEASLKRSATGQKPGSPRGERGEESDINTAARAAGANEGWLSKVTEQMRKERYAVRSLRDAPLLEAYRSKVRGWQGLADWARARSVGEEEDESGSGRALGASNAGHGLVSYFLDDAVAVVPHAKRTVGHSGRLFPRAVGGASGDTDTAAGDEDSSTRASWLLRLGELSVGRQQDGREVLEEVQRGECFTDGSRARYEHHGLAEIYDNDARGIEQTFELYERPEGEGLLLVRMQMLGLTVASSTLDSVVLVDGTGQAAVRYHGIEAWDAGGRPLLASMSASEPSRVGEDAAVTLVVDDTDARYPVTIDPVLSGPGWAREGEQAGANFGISVSSAGDVDADGFSDVLVGAYGHDGAAGADSGKAYLYLGSSTGLSTTAAWTQEGEQAGANFGISVSSAGDVNGDGFSDALVGTPRHDGVAGADSGKAYLYLGSSTVTAQ